MCIIIINWLPLRHLFCSCRMRLRNNIYIELVTILTTQSVTHVVQHYDKFAFWLFYFLGVLFLRIRDLVYLLLHNLIRILVQFDPESTPCWLFSLQCSTNYYHLGIGGYFQFRSCDLFCCSLGTTFSGTTFRYRWLLVFFKV